MTNEEMNKVLYTLKTSEDANARVRAAAKLGDYSDYSIINDILDVIWKDEKSNVQEMAVHSYARIAKKAGLDSLKKIASEHPEPNVRMYSLIKLAEVDFENSNGVINKATNESNKIVRAIALKQIVDYGDRKFAPILLEKLQTENHLLCIRNIIQALGLWRYFKAKEKLEEILKATNSLEIKTISHFALARMDVKASESYLRSEKIDETIVIRKNGKNYRGREMLIALLKID